MSDQEAFVSSVGRLVLRTGFLPRLRRAFMFYWIPLVAVALLAVLITAIAQTTLPSKIIISSIGAFAFGIVMVLWEDVPERRAHWKHVAAVSAIAIPGSLAEPTGISIVFVAFATGLAVGNLAFAATTHQRRPGSKSSKSR